MQERGKASDFQQELLDLYDDYVHGRVERRAFLQNVTKFAIGGVTAEAILARLTPNYAWAEQVKADDERISTEQIEYDSPEGGGKIKGLLAMPAKVDRKIAAVLVVHENRGLNPYIADVVRRMAVNGFLALGPDALSPLGGYPGNDDAGREMQQKRDGEEMMHDFMAAATFLKEHPQSNGKVGVVGFCYGGGVANELAVRMPETIVAAAPFYGRQPAVEDVSKIKASLLIHYAGLDQRINAGWTAYEEALKANNVDYEAYIYEGVNHGFHNDTTPRYDQTAAELAQNRTVEFFKKHLQ